MVLAGILAIALDPAGAVFDQIQVDWIADTGTVKNLEQVMNKPLAELIRLLGDDRAAVRRLAIRELYLQGDTIADALYWGARTDNPQIVHECRLLISALFVCHTCEGCGKFRPDPKDDKWAEDCKTCSGTGDLRYERHFGWDEIWQCQAEEIRLKDLFRKPRPFREW